MRLFDSVLALVLAGAMIATHLGYGMQVWPALVLIGIGALALHQNGRLSLSRLLNGESDVTYRTGVRFDDIGGQAQAKRELLEAIDVLRSDAAARRLGIRPLRGILLTGPPGTGKTMLAKAVATHVGSALIATSGSEFIEVYAGTGAQRVRQLFKRARALARRSPQQIAVVFIDEIDILGAKRGLRHHHMEYEQTLNQLLVEMDGLSTPHQTVTVVVIGATNRPDMLDEALLRPGRFDRIVHVDLPDLQGRIQILERHLADKPLAGDVTIEQLARECYGFSGAQLEAFANEAAILAWRSGKQAIDRQDFAEAADKVLLGEKAERRPTPAEKRRIAVHEAGHALIATLLRPGSVAVVTIVPRGNTLGFVRQQPVTEHLQTRDDMLIEAEIALAGYAAEALVFGSTSTGARGDLQRVHRIVEQMLHSGMTALGVCDPALVPELQRYAVVDELYRSLQERVTQRLMAHRAQLERLVEALLREETLTQPQLHALLQAGIAAPANERFVS